MLCYICFCLQAPTSQNSGEPPVKKAKVEGKLLMQPDSRYACDNYDIIYITLLVGWNPLDANETEKRQQV